jgi:hypothetical protein
MTRMAGEPQQPLLKQRATLARSARKNIRLAKSLVIVETS